MVRETGLEPACCHQHTDLNRARLPIPPFPLKVVDGGGFEPPKSATADLQSAPFGHSGTYPRFALLCHRRWSWRWDLNPQPADYKSVALPLSYTSWEKMAIRRGLEPLTSSVTGWHSNQLNYRTILFKFKKVGGPSGTRTPDQSVMSRPL